MFDYRHAVFYQIWPRSFNDSNHDGIGDLKGAVEKLDYIRSLGADAIWLSPVYASPNSDYGYDISDYYSINPEYGTMDDLKLLIAEARKRNIVLIMDLVANHTSTKHEWFEKALADPESPYRKYYYFRKGGKDYPPNNWISFFGGSAWQKAEDDMWYMTLYTSTQADLDWTNPDVRKEIVNVMKFYLDMGIEGFRMDTINTIDKAENLPSKDPWKKGWQFADELVIDGPRVRQYLCQLKDEALKPYGAFALGEGVLATPESVKQYCGGEDSPVDMMFQFDLISLGYGSLGKYDFRNFYRITDKMIKETTRKWMTAEQKDHTWLGNYISNHDHKRPLDRFADDGKYRIKSAKMLAMYNFTLLGSPFIYQGEEIGMTNPKMKKENWRDYESFSSSKAMTEIMHVPYFFAEKVTNFVTRDNARTPMQWDDSEFAGFSCVTPWIDVNDDFRTWNVKAQEHDPSSILSFYRKLSALRHSEEVLCTGRWKELLEDHPHVLCYLRENESDRIMVLLNLSGRTQRIHFNKNEIWQAEDLLTNDMERQPGEKMTLSPYEAHLFKLIG